MDNSHSFLDLQTRVVAKGIQDVTEFGHAEQVKKVDNSFDSVKFGTCADFGVGMCEDG